MLLAHATPVAAPLRRHAVVARAVTFVESDRATGAAAGARVRIMALPERLARAVPVRARDYLAGRHCAYEALRAIGASAWGVAVDADGAPVWPAEVVGSITHTAGRAAAVVARRADLLGLGVDSERVLTPAEADELAPSVVGEIGGATDARALGAEMGWAEFVTLAFSAKESVYKCLHPLVRTFFDFADAHVVAVDAARGTLAVRLARTLAPGFERGMPLDVAWEVRDGLVHTLTALPASPDRAAIPAESRT